MAESDPTSSEPRTAERHAFRPGSFVVGLIVLTVAVLFLVDDGGLVQVDEAGAGAVLLLVTGATIVIRSALRLVGRR